VEVCHNRHGNAHEYGIEDVEEVFVSEEETIVALADLLALSFQGQYRTAPTMRYSTTLKTLLTRINPLAPYSMYMNRFQLRSVPGSIDGKPKAFARR